MTGAAESEVAEGLYKAYEEHSKTLRAWLVAYGIGAPVLFLTNDRLAARLAASGSAQSIGALFLVGVALQVLLAAINKSVMWACYYVEHYPAHAGDLRFRLARWFSDQFWIDFLVDVMSLALFAIATWRAFKLVVAVS